MGGRKELYERGIYHSEKWNGEEYTLVLIEPCNNGSVKVPCRYKFKKGYVKNFFCISIIVKAI